MIERMYILCVIIIIKSKVWTITVYYCLGLGHETMVCAVCLSIFLYPFEHVYSWLVGAPRCSNHGVCYFCSIPNGPVHTATSLPAPGDSYLFYHDVLKFLTSANQKHRIWSCDESGLCNPRPCLLGDEVVVGHSLMFRKMDPWNVIWNILQDKTNKNQL